MKHKTPIEAWNRCKPTVSHLKVFGCLTFSLIHAHARQKLDYKSQKNIFIGFCKNSKAYKLYNPITCKVFVSKDVIFREEANWAWEPCDTPAHTVMIRDANISIPEVENNVEDASRSTSEHHSSFEDTQGEILIEVAPIDGSPPRESET